MKSPSTSSRRSFFKKSALAGAMALSGFQALGKGVERGPQYSRPSDLKITDIKCGYIRGGHSLFVKIYTNQDIWGCGEGVDATPGTYHLVKMLGQRLRDKNPLNVHRLFEDLRRSGFFEGAQSGMYVAVLSAVETALWDLVPGQDPSVLRYRPLSISLAWPGKICAKRCGSEKDGLHRREVRPGPKE
jgi:galactonate dehydratase